MAENQLPEFNRVIMQQQGDRRKRVLFGRELLASAEEFTVGASAVRDLIVRRSSFVLSLNNGDFLSNDEAQRMLVEIQRLTSQINTMCWPTLDATPFPSGCRVIKVLPQYGSAYTKDGDAILSTPILADGSISLDYDEWSEIDFMSIDQEDAFCIRAAFEKENSI